MPKVLTKSGLRIKKWPEVQDMELFIIDLRKQGLKEAIRTSQTLNTFKQ